MGSVLAKVLDGNQAPRIGLLNVGEEEIKGNIQVKAASALLSESNLAYAGYAEGDDIYNGSFDVIVCDGFVGTPPSQTSHRLAKMIAFFIREEFSRNLLTKLAALVAMPVLKAFRKKIDPRLYNGATLLGLRGIVIKSHGGTDKTGFANAISVAAGEIRGELPERISRELQHYQGS